ncbi:hypothetical protein BU23DRAFT_565131 [Bimuria novae-zelandiae CBS 107.79]|uniref:Cytochrome P450 n=1 Tax=Bimuria novae-zelandiae CBS 107.79 TaxID=1447943 RepID=A0A6A5VHB7_9PLEO|nr:hypothetical protein BU23DRAFT_565131 [Bimuria novae-zelandiae CBS 107.79]
MPSDDPQVLKLRRYFHPFSIGPMNCAGQNLAMLEFQLVVAKTIWATDFSLPEGGINEEGFHQQGPPVYDVTDAYLSLKVGPFLRFRQRIKDVWNGSIMVSMRALLSLKNLMKFHQFVINCCERASGCMVRHTGLDSSLMRGASERQCASNLARSRDGIEREEIWKPSRSPAVWVRNMQVVRIIDSSYFRYCERGSRWTESGQCSLIVTDVHRDLPSIG